ncbi:hypothetical protein CCAX7_26050 [Capsulimonas corticalis]|uniref:Uncharacterized protein n=1 Tax=Capsulimonas corticalis TaxID=2219043 RepID=A0A402CVW0_9BACT|nr:hypothetical protein [Capsulimonas corticalis]BDI30554.1 hypothetical protein CCAX7_26050 [Capsulimonas corticalis]
MSETITTAPPHIGNLFGPEWEDELDSMDGIVKSVGSFMLKPHKRRVILTLSGEPSEPGQKAPLIFMEAYSPDEADMVADQLKRMAQRARKGQNVDLQDEERYYMRDFEGFFDNLDEEDDEDADA